MSRTSKSILRGIRNESKTSKVDTGEVYGYLTVYGLSNEALAVTQAFGQREWDCKCRCGNFIRVRAGRIVYGNRKSCGCKAVEANARQVKRYEARVRLAQERMPDPAESRRIAAKYGE